MNDISYLKLYEVNLILTLITVLVFWLNVRLNSFLRMTFVTHVEYDSDVVITTKRSCSSKSRCLWLNNSDVSSVEVILLSTLSSSCVKWYLKTIFLWLTSMHILHSLIQLRISNLETRIRTDSCSRVLIQIVIVETFLHKHLNDQRLLNEHRVSCSWDTSMMFLMRCVWSSKILHVNMMIFLTMWNQRFSTMWVKIMNV